VAAEFDELEFPLRAPGNLHGAARALLERFRRRDSLESLGDVQRRLFCVGVRMRWDQFQSASPPWLRRRDRALACVATHARCDLSDLEGGSPISFHTAVWSAVDAECFTTLKSALGVDRSTQKAGRLLRQVLGGGVIYLWAHEVAADPELPPNDHELVSDLRDACAASRSAGWWSFHAWKSFHALAREEQERVRAAADEQGVGQVDVPCWWAEMSFGDDDRFVPADT
jgi:hypothetical protein